MKDISFRSLLIFSIIIVIVGFFLIFIFPEQASYIIIGIIVFAGAGGFIGLKKIPSEVRESAKFNLSSSKRILMVLTGLALWVISYYSFQLINSVITSSYVLLFVPVLLIAFAIGAGFITFGITPQNLVKNPQNFYKRFIRRLFRI